MNTMLSCIVSKLHHMPIYVFATVIGVNIYSFGFIVTLVIVRWSLLILCSWATIDVRIIAPTLFQHMIMKWPCTMGK